MSKTEILFYSAFALSVAFALLAIVINANTPQPKK